VSAWAIATRKVDEDGYQSVDFVRFGSLWPPGWQGKGVVTALRLQAFP
jgi:hypothetical protein